MKIINKIKTIKLSPIESALYGYIAFNLINLMIHIAGFYTYPLLAQMEYVVYICKILLVQLIRKRLRSEGSRFAAEIKWFKRIQICDFAELFICVFAYQNIPADFYTIILWVIKGILNYQIFASLIGAGVYDTMVKKGDVENKNYKYFIFRWLGANLLVVAGIIGEIYIRKTALLVVVGLIILYHFYLQIDVVMRFWRKGFKAPNFEEIFAMEWDETEGEVHIPKALDSSNVQSALFPESDKRSQVNLQSHFDAIDSIDEELNELEKEHVSLGQKIKNFCKINIFGKIDKAISVVSGLFNRVDKKYRYALYLVLFIVFIICRSTYQEGRRSIYNTDGEIVTDQKTVTRSYNIKYYYTEDEAQNIYQYNTCNHMPSFSMFYHEKYGLINVETGYNTGAKYDDELTFDKTGIAYDQDRHFINTKGEEVLKVPYIVKARTSFRQEILNDFLEKFDTNDKYSPSFMMSPSPSVCGQFIISSDYTFFANGVAAYYTDYNLRYGLIDESGKLVTLPKFCYFSGYFDFEVSSVINYNRTELDVVNNAGKSILKNPTNSVHFYDKVRIIRCDSGYHNALYSFDGTYLGSGYYDSNYYYPGGDVIYFYKYDDGGDIFEKDATGTLEVYYGDAQKIFSSDEYYRCFAYSDNDVIDYLVVWDHDKICYLIDLDGNLICPKGYVNIFSTARHDTFIAVNEDYSFDLIHLDGSVVETGYQYCDLEDHGTTIVVEKSDEDLINYMDLDENLLQEWTPQYY
ncbi:MAG: hypothetical protein K5900_07485 [Butyrivibrio sp.]|nr:hypothetical protein [Butyrivibrio sp.]